MKEVTIIFSVYGGRLDVVRVCKNYQSAINYLLKNNCINDDTYMGHNDWGRPTVFDELGKNWKQVIKDWDDEWVFSGHALGIYTMRKFTIHT